MDGRKAAQQMVIINLYKYIRLIQYAVYYELPWW